MTRRLIAVAAGMVLLAPLVAACNTQQPRCPSPSPTVHIRADGNGGEDLAVLAAVPGRVSGGGGGGRGGVSGGGRAPAPRPAPVPVPVPVVVGGSSGGAPSPDCRS